MKRIIFGFLLAIPLFALALPVYAITPPDPISILSAKAVQNTINKDGDMAIVFHYKLHYAGEYPTVPASESIMFRLYSPDGTMLLASAVPFVCFNNGYGQGVSGFYFSKEDVEELELEWKASYKIDIAGSPVHFDPLPDPYYYGLTTADYSSATNQAANQEIMKNYIISVSRLIESDLLSTTDAGIVLSSLGEFYFRGAMPGIVNIAPSLFYIQVYVPEPIELEYTTDLAETYKGTLEGSDIMLGLDRLGEKAGISGGTTAAFIVFIVAIGLIIFLAAKGWGVEPGIIGAGLVLTLGAVLLGDALMVIRVFMGLIGGMLIMYQLFLKRA